MRRNNDRKVEKGEAHRPEMEKRQKEGRSAGLGNYQRRVEFHDGARGWGEKMIKEVKGWGEESVGGWAENVSR